MLKSESLGLSSLLADRVRVFGFISSLLIESKSLWASLHKAPLHKVSLSDSGPLAVLGDSAKKKGGC